MGNITEARRIGGSLAVIIPHEMAKKEKISPGDMVSIDVKRVDELTGWWGKLGWVKKSTQSIMEEIDENEND